MCLPAVDTRLHTLCLGCLHPQRSGTFQAGHLMCIVPMFASPAVDTRAFSVLRRQLWIRVAVLHRPPNRGGHTTGSATSSRGTVRPNTIAIIRVGRQHTFSRAPVLLTHRAQRGGIHYGPSQRCAFVAPRSGLPTMPTGGHEDATAPSAVTSAAAGPVRRFTPIAPPHDMWPSAF